MESKTNYILPDSEVLYQVNDNNELAKNFLFEKYTPLIHKEVQKYVKSASSVGIEYNDLMQEAMLAFSEALNNYNDKENVKFITFATLCIKRRMINVLKKQATNKEQILNNYISFEKEILPQKTVLDIVSDIEAKQPLNKMIIEESLKEVSKDFEKKLNTYEKQIYLLYLNGKKIEDIAKEMNKPVKSIYNNLYRIKKKLKTSWKMGIKDI